MHEFSSLSKNDIVVCRIKKKLNKKIATKRLRSDMSLSHSYASSSCTVEPKENKRQKRIIIEKGDLQRYKKQGSCAGPSTCTTPSSSVIANQEALQSPAVNPESTCTDISSIITVSHDEALQSLAYDCSKDDSGASDVFWDWNNIPIDDLDGTHSLEDIGLNIDKEYIDQAWLSCAGL